MDLQRTSSRELGNSLQVVIELPCLQAAKPITNSEKTFTSDLELSSDGDIFEVQQPRTPLNQKNTILGYFYRKNYNLLGLHHFSVDTSPVCSTCQDLRETATAISEDPPGAKEKPSEGERDKTSRTENTLSEAGEEIAESGEVLTKPSEWDLEKSHVKGFPPPSSPWTRDREASLQPVIEETNGVVSMVIPTEVLSNANPLWRCYVVGYFIGDAPHVGSIHATVNRIWANPKNKTKIDVQFIEKNTVFFRIENEQMRGRVLQKKYWHIVDIPLVVNECQNYSDIVETMAEYSDCHVLEEILHNCFLFLRSFAVAVWVKEPQHACHVIPWDCVP
ncbi:hypothetical protein YC2023_052814 [Brassica napus]